MWTHLHGAVSVGGCQGATGARLLDLIGPRGTCPLTAPSPHPATSRVLRETTSTTQRRKWGRVSQWPGKKNSQEIVSFFLSFSFDIFFLLVLVVSAYLMYRSNSNATDSLTLLRTPILS